MEEEQTKDILGSKPGTGDLIVVGIGASAGGVEALQAFFRHVPADSDMAYVVILHLSPDYDSKLTEILQRETPIPVIQVTEKVKIEPNHIYVVPPNQHLVMMEDAISVSPNMLTEDRRAPVDIFFRSLAETYLSRAVGIILSGTGANGSMGIKRIKERGGATFVQNPREAQFNEMPRNAVATDLIDGILSVNELTAKLISYRNNLIKVHITIENNHRTEDQQHALSEIFTQLRIRTKHDFSNYKRPTLLRRIERRINVHNLDSLTAYAEYIQQHPEEAHALLKDLLISVTNFFRDKKAFDAIERDILPRLFHEKKAGSTVRIWTIGCATGEEAYSIAILCAELTLNRPDVPKVQIFATDIDDDAIAVARNGVYTLNDVADVSPERLRRYFTKEGDVYRIRREIREMILFANHNVLKDPPFSHLDMVSCRNLMIYLNNTAQERVLDTVHFALEPGGFLFLGSAESVDGAGDLFLSANREQHIYQSRAVSTRFFPVPESVPSINHVSIPEQKISQEAESRALGRISFADLHQQLLEQYAPPSIVVNQDYDIVHLSEHAGRYLQVGGGEPSKNLLKLIRPELRLELRTAFYQAVERRANVEARGLKIKLDDNIETINIHVRPVLRDGDTAQGFMLVLFEPGTSGPEQDKVVYTTDEPMARHLVEELIRMKSQLRVNIEQQELQAEELKASNEELQAMNEELRSAVEELETSKEELQSINEELTTVNQELKVKVEETTLSNNNFQNLINSTDIATIFLDRSLRIYMFTPAAKEIFNMIPADFGRPVSDITNKLHHPGLLDDAEEVLQKLKTVEREIWASNGNLYLMRAIPYRTEEDRINGVIITFINITERKKWDEALRHSEERMRMLIKSAKDYAIFTLDIERNIISWSPGAEVIFGYMEREILEQTGDIVFTPEDREHGDPEKEAITAVTEGYADNERWHMRKNGSRFWGSGVTSPLRNDKGEVIGFVKIMRDLTERRQAEEAKATELRNTQLLRDLGMEVITTEDIQVLYDKVVAAAVLLTKADAGTVQLYDESTADLMLLSAQGFPEAITKRFYRVGANSATSCGISLKTGERSFVDFDAPNIPDPDGSLRVHVENGYLSAQSTPLISRFGKLIGVISTHWHEHHHRPTEDELRYMDLLARQASDLIEQRQIEKAIRASEEQKAFLLKLSDALRYLSDAVDVHTAVTRTAMEYFKADRCFYCEVDGDAVTIRQDASKEGLPSVAGAYSLNSVPMFKALLQSGRPIVVQDVNTTDLMDEELKRLCIEMKILSFADVPLIKNGQAEGILCLTQCTPRNWTNTAVELAKETAERTWAAVEKARTMDALRRSEEDIRLVTDNLPALVAYHDREQRYLFVNAEFERYFGMPKEQILGKTMQEWLPRHVYERLRPNVEKVLAGERVSFEDMEQDKFGPGLHGWTEENYIPRFGEDGNVEGFFVLAYIITERKRTEQALLESEERFRTLTDVVPQIIWTNDPEGKATFFNKRWYEYSGLSYEQSAGPGWIAIVHPDDEFASVERWQKALAEGEVFDTEYRLRRADGVYRWHIGRNVPLRNDTGEIISWFGSATDIEDLNIAQASLTESEKRYRAIVSQSSVGITRTDSYGTLIFMNEKARSMLGFNGDNGAGRTIWELTAPDDVEELKRLYNRLIVQALPFQYEGRLKRLNGSLFWASVSMAPIKDAEGKVGSSVAVIVDITGRKQAEEALRETMERFQYAVKATKDVIWEIDFNRNHVWWSSMMHTQFGYSQRDVQHTIAWFESLIHSDDQERVTNSFATAVGSKDALWMDEFRYRQASGEYIYVNCRGFIIRDAEGKALRMIGAMQDITERRLAEEAIRKSEERLRVTMQSATDYVIITSDANGYIENWNSGAERIFNYNAAEVIGRYDDFIYTPEDRAAGVPEKEMETARKEGRAMDERWHLRKDGARLFLSGVLAPIRSNGVLTGYVKVARDMTAQKQAEDALQAAQNSLNTALEAAHMGIWDLDLATDRVMRSPRHDQLLGYSTYQEDWSFEKAVQYMSAEDKAKFMNARDRMFITGIFDVDARIQHPNGNVCWVEVYGRLFKNDKGEPTHAAGVIFDITDRKTVEQKKDEFIGIASHELKTPVTSIKAYTEILHEQFVEKGDMRSAGFLQKLNGQVDRLTGLIRDLLDVTRISEGRLVMKVSKVDINQILRDTTEEVQATAAKHTIELNLQELPPVKGDREKLQQVFINLISNAIKYSPEADKVLIRSYQDNGNVKIEVQDFGLGMSVETKTKLFERFFRASDPHIATFPGLGLGLYISMEIVKQHQGTILAQSEKGKGSVFTVVLPADQ